MFALWIPLQILMLVFILFAASRAVMQFRGGSIHFGAMLFWLSIWIVASIAIFFPEETTRLARLAGIGRGVDVVMYLSIALLFYLVFRLHVVMEDTRTSINKLVREISLKEVEGNKKKKK